MSNIFEKRLKRERAAREAAEKILEEKSRELYFKNQELKTLNEKLNATLELRRQELHDSEAQRFSLFQNSAMGIALTLHGQILKVNHTFAEMLGYKVEEVIGKHISDVSYKEDITPSMKNTDDVQAGKKDKFTMQKRYKRKNNSFFWANTHVSAVKDELGNIKYHLAIIENIQDKKIAERKTEMLVQQLKEINESLESYAQVVSHDLKSPITGINTILNWLEAMPVSDEVKEHHEMMKGLVEKSYSLIDNVIAYSKVNTDQEDRERFSVEQLLIETIQFLPIPHHIEIVQYGRFPFINANKTKIQQVFSNLIDNATKHIDKEEGLISISCSEDEHYWIFKVRDNGEGIEERHFSKIFNIFETLNNSKNKGTGIGLSLIKKVINQYQGTITVDSKVGEFTEFTFSLAKSETALNEN